MQSGLVATAKTLLHAGLALFYPDCCQICADEAATPHQGYVGNRCRSGPGGLRWVLPPYCERCGLPFPAAITGPFSCANCRNLDLHFSHARAAVVATPLVLEIVRRYKYHNALWFEPFLAQILIQQAAPTLRLGHWDLLVPVPLHPARQREREFNQSARLAQHLSTATGLPLNVHILRRVQHTQTQTTLSRTHRAANVRHAFTVSPGTRLHRQRVVVIDDVLTTGATTSACARTLRQAGAADVAVWTVARGL
jgi:ComF family protein